VPPRGSPRERCPTAARKATSDGARQVGLAHADRHDSLLGRSTRQDSAARAPAVRFETISVAELDRITIAEVRGRPRRPVPGRPDVRENEPRVCGAGERIRGNPITRAHARRRSKRSSTPPTSRDWFPSEAITPRCRAGRSLPGKAIARHRWRIARSAPSRCRQSNRELGASRIDESDHGRDARFPR